MFHFFCITFSELSMTVTNIYDDEAVRYNSLQSEAKSLIIDIFLESWTGPVKLHAQ